VIAFDAPLLLLAAPAVALLVGILAILAFRTRVRHAARWSVDLARLSRDSGRYGWVLPAAAALAATTALAGPRFGRQVVTAESKALNLVVAMDVSRSMLAEDARPSRLGRAQREARRLIHDLASDRIGLVAFAGQSFIMSPLTVDAGALQLLIEALDPDIASAGGTALARALRQGGELLLTGSGVADRVLVVFTDGEAHDSLPAVLEAAARLRRDGIRLVLAPQGGREPVPIPLRGMDGVQRGEQLDENGQPVRTARGDEVLRAIADAAEAPIVAAELPDQAGAIRDLVLAYKRAPQATAVTASGIPRAWIPMLVAVVLLLVHAATRRTAALAGVLLAAGYGSAAAQGIAHRGDVAWRDGQLRQAAERYIADVNAGRGGDTAWLAAGTAGLALGDTALARAALTHAAGSMEPEIRFRALYNLGLLHLRQAERDSVNRDRLLAEGRRRYREALLLRPGDAAAKWNLELAIRRTPPSGGGGGAPDPQQAQAGGGAPPAPRPQGLTPAQAEQILNSIGEDERRTRQQLTRRMAQRRSGQSAERDW
jgi:Ca-activated chloride channel family protein